MATVLLPVLMLLIFLACLAFVYQEGMWGAALSLINAVTAALVASAYYETLANFLEEQYAGFTYAWDFLSLWAIFAACMIVFRLLTDRLSRVKVKFLKIVDQIGSGVLAVMVGGVMVAFILFTFHTAPLGKKFMAGGFDNEQQMMLGTAPDRQWESFVRSRSKGGYDTSPANPFDPHGQWRKRYEDRRVEIENHVSKSKSLRK